MSIVKSISKSLYDNVQTVEVITPATWRGADYSPEWFFGNDGVDYHFTYGGHLAAAKAYELCSPLTSIINKQAQADINGIPYILNLNGKAKGKESTSDFAKKVRRLMNNPNPLQTRKQFEAQLKIYTKVFGWCFVMPVYPVGWEKAGLSEATSMWVIPPYMVDVTETDKLFYQQDLGGIVKKVVLKYRNLKTEINVPDLLFFKDFVPSMNSVIFPESRILSLKMEINNIAGAYESRHQLIHYAGAQGIFTGSSDSNGPLPIKESDKLQLQKDFQRYGLRKDQWKYIFSPSEIKWQQVGRPTRDLMLFEEIVDDIQRLCDGFNHPYRLLAQESNSLGGADLKVHTRNLYADAIIPDSQQDYEVWNRAFKAEENGCIIEKSFSHIDALQEDKLLNAQASRQMNEACKLEFFNNLITLNRWLEKIGEDTRTDGDKYYYQLVAEGVLFGDTNTKIQINGEQQNQSGATQSGATA